MLGILTEGVRAAWGLWSQTKCGTFTLLTSLVSELLAAVMEGSCRPLADQEPEACEEGQEGRAGKPATDQRDPIGGGEF